MLLLLLLRDDDDADFDDDFDAKREKRASRRPTKKQRGGESVSKAVVVVVISPCLYVLLGATQDVCASTTKEDIIYPILHTHLYERPNTYLYQQRVRTMDLRDAFLRGNKP